MKQDRQLLAFNRGIVSPRGLARIDIDRIQISAETMTNWMPRVLGSMMLRPGMEYQDSEASELLIPFTFSFADQALIAIRPGGTLGVFVDGERITYPSVSTTISNSDFTLAATGWTDASDTNGSSTYPFADRAIITGNGVSDYGKLYQEVTVAPTDQGTEHCLKIDVIRGPVRLRIGSTNGDDDVFGETFLQRGDHFVSFTPSGNFFIEFANDRAYGVLVNECSINNGVALEISHGFSSEEIETLRWAQVGDVIYMASKYIGSGTDDNFPVCLKRRGNGRSWSYERYQPEDGPFDVQNVTGTTITPDALSGDVTLTASEPVFESSMIGSLVSIDSNGQDVESELTAADTFTETIRVVGSEGARVFQIVLSGTWSGTVTLQFAFSEDGPWNDTTQVFTGNTDTTYDDGQDGSIIFYRIGFKSGDYTSGTLTARLSYSNGSITGICRLTSVSSSTEADGIIYRSFGSTDSSTDWRLGAWSGKKGYPSSVAIDEGRLWWAGLDRIFGSVSDAYDSFDLEALGDSGPIIRSIGAGPIRNINWLLPLARLLIGTQDTSADVQPQRMDGNSPLSLRSSNFDEPVTPTNFNIKPASSRGVFVDRSGQRLYELVYDIQVQDYQSADLSVYTPDLNLGGIKQIAVQMKPEMRIHCIRDDGTAGVLVYDRLENVICWLTIESPAASGSIKSVAVLPGTEEDEVYYLIDRTVNEFTIAHLVKWAKETEAQGGAINKMADSFTQFDGPVTTLTGLTHLEGEEVVVWGNSKDLGTFTVTSGEVTLPEEATNVTVGLPYTGQWKSNKLASVQGIGLMDRKRVNRVGFVAENLHHQGLQYGPSFDYLNDLPAVEEGVETAEDTVYDTYHEDDISFGGSWDPDSRICLQAQAPRPATLLALIAVMESVEKT